jgi:hypothetical protein
MPQPRSDLPDTAVPDAVLAAVRSVPASIPVPRAPADDRDHDGWERHGAYEIHYEELHTEESER